MSLPFWIGTHHGRTVRHGAGKIWNPSDDVALRGSITRARMQASFRRSGVRECRSRARELLVLSALVLVSGHGSPSGGVVESWSTRQGALRSAVGGSCVCGEKEAWNGTTCLVCMVTPSGCDGGVGTKPEHASYVQQTSASAASSACTWLCDPGYVEINDACVSCSACPAGNYRTSCGYDKVELAITTTSVKCLEVDPQQRTWVDAQAECASHGGNLASIESSKDQTAVAAMLEEPSFPESLQFVDGTESWDAFHGYTSNETTYSGHRLWHNREPTNDCSTVFSNSSANLYWEGQKIYWDEAPCERHYASICSREFSFGPLGGPIPARLFNQQCEQREVDRTIKEEMVAWYQFEGVALDSGLGCFGMEGSSVTFSSDSRSARPQNERNPPQHT